MDRASLNNKLQHLDNQQLRDILSNMLDTYCIPSFGSMSKHDIDLLMFDSMVRMGVIPDNPTIYDVMRDLKVTRSKARTLVHRPGHPDIKFKAVPSVLPNKKWTIKIERPDGSPEDKTINLFCLDDIYKLHDQLEVKDIMDFKDNYPDGYISDLMNRLRAENIGSSLSQKDIFRMLFGIEYDEDKVLLRPLGKMKRDLIEDLMK
ncbi:hypothetical protein JQM83_03300 [Parabacteroides distasonis]|nr:hypothetical protein [Parabacteroides distasonis]